MRRRGSRVAALLLVGLLAGCDGDSSGPTFDSSVVSIVDEVLVPVTDRICHVRGTVVNTGSDVAVTVVMRWRAFDASDAGIATTRLTVSGVAPGTQVGFESTGFASNDRGLVGCSDIARFERIETTIGPA